MCFTVDKLALCRPKITAVFYIYGKVAIVEPAQPMENCDVSNAVHSAWAFRAVGATASDVRP